MVEDTIWWTVKLVLFVVLETAWATWVLVKIDAWMTRKAAAAEVADVAVLSDQRAAYVFTVVRHALGAKDERLGRTQPVVAKDDFETRDRKRA